MTEIQEIQQFLEPRKIAVAGASRNEKKFGGYVIKELMPKGFELFPVNPNADEIQGLKCYKSVSELPDDIKNLLVVTSKTETAGVVAEAIEKGLERFWFQQGAETDEAIALAIKAGKTVISKKCILMFATPVNGIHKFHRFFNKIVGAYPKK